MAGIDIKSPVLDRNSPAVDDSGLATRERPEFKDLVIDGQRGAPTAGTKLTGGDLNGHSLDRVTSALLALYENPQSAQTGGTQPVQDADIDLKPSSPPGAPSFKISKKDDPELYDAVKKAQAAGHSISVTVDPEKGATITMVANGGAIVTNSVIPLSLKVNGVEVKGDVDKRVKTEILEQIKLRDNFRYKIVLNDGVSLEELKERGFSFNIDPSKPKPGESFYALTKLPPTNRVVPKLHTLSGTTDSIEVGRSETGSDITITSIDQPKQNGTVPRQTVSIGPDGIYNPRGR